MKTEGGNNNNQTPDSNEKESNRNEAAGRSAHILELNIDCVEEAFDYLPLGDLICIGSTCKRLNQVAGYIYQQNYSGNEVFCRDRHIKINLHVNADYLIHYFNNVTIFAERDLDFYLSLPSQLHRQKHISLKDFEISPSQIERMNEIFSKVESFTLHYLKLDGCLHTNILASCPNLKYLCIEGQPESIIIGSDNDWLLRKYPTLEHFKLAQRRPFQLDALTNFLERNTNIKKFSTYTYFFWENRERLSQANVELDDLALCAIFEKIEDFHPLIHLLNELHARGFYKRLHFSHNRCEQTLIDQLTSAKELVTLYLMYGANVRLSGLTNVEDLFYEDSSRINDLEEMATKLNKLERIRFSIAQPGPIKMLVCKAASLKTIIVYSFWAQTYGNKQWATLDQIQLGNLPIFDLRQLNEERGKLPNARKVRLYVEETVYLATKWAIKETNFGFVRMLRVDANESKYPWR